MNSGKPDGYDLPAAMVEAGAGVLWLAPIEIWPPETAEDLAVRVFEAMDAMAGTVAGGTGYETVVTELRLLREAVERLGDRLTLIVPPPEFPPVWSCGHAHASRGAAVACAQERRRSAAEIATHTPTG